MPLPRAALVGAAASLAVVTAGCGSSAKVRHGSVLGVHGSNTPSLHYGGKSTVVMRDDGFHPRRLTIRANTSVQWVNRGHRAHTVTWTGGTGTQHFHSGPVEPGRRFRFRFARVSRVSYRSTRPGDGALTGVIVAR